MTAPPLLPALPRALGRYEIQSELGRGSMGVVYKAEDPVLGRSVALKVIRIAFPVGQDEQRILEQRFLREATLAASLSHPNIVVVHDVGRDTDSRTPFIALEYLEGRTLAAVMARRECVDWQLAVRMAIRLADALHHAHGHGVVHRDVKPSNIMMLPGGQAKILDFGVAKDASAPLTTPGELWGTPFYMSPEQASGGMVDGRSDLFALGAVLYELLTGRRAFAGEGVAQVIHGLLYEDPLPPTRINPTLPPDMDTVVARALAKDPGARYPDGRAFIEDLEDVLESRPLRKSGPVPPSAALPVELEARTSLDPSPPTITRWPRPARGPRSSHRVRTLTLGAVLGVAAVAVVLGASTGTVQTSSAVTPAQMVIAAAAAAPAPAVVAGRHRVPPRPVEMAHVAIALEHSLRQGRIKVWVDDKVVLEAPLVAAAESRSLLLFKRRKGYFADVLNVTPGDHSVRLEVEGDGEARDGALRGVLRRDQTRLLAVKVGGKLSLEWKS
jgi:eukaryotic-like serine/threonine-protein kinase